MTRIYDGAPRAPPRDMRRLATVLLVLAGSHVAVAEPAKVEERYAVGINNPLGWMLGNVAASGWVALDKHFAIRANTALYSAHEGYISLLQNGLESWTTVGRIYDFGAGVVWAPLSMWRGPTFELGGLLRIRDSDTFNDDTGTAYETSLVGVRALVGWNHSISRRAFVAAGIGVSVGRERGETFKFKRDDRAMEFLRETVDETVVDSEVYLRFGVRLGTSSAR